MNNDADNVPFPGLEQLRGKVRRALRDICPATIDEESVYQGHRKAAGRDLPPHYLVHFLFIELLEFPHLGHSEKVAWSIPISYRERVYSIEHRKFGLGVFAEDATAEDETVKELVTSIHRATKAAQPFFDWLASRAVITSRINVLNDAAPLLDRFEFLLNCYREKKVEVQVGAEKRPEQKLYRKDNDNLTLSADQKPMYERYRELEREKGWLALAAVDAFFSWTEHVFVLLAILFGKATTGVQVSDLAKADWSEKFKCVLDITDSTTKRFFDELIEIRRETRNFMAHGAFGKNGRAFHFHSLAGAVPVALSGRSGSRRFMVASATYFEDEVTLSIVSKFIEHLWAGDRSPARIYIHGSELDLILTMASDGTYADALRSDEEMQMFVDHLENIADRSLNMDW